ncbi:MBL fold metallo-hydrolase [Neorhodopirellula pilleata]|uniref:Putative metallo-hydrolase n=1 Tax=Neorhodopirellula pilleata TaxID=2714738 RepID=A0A5C6AWA0_9BACT|nr:MBL fold metallo-hydrolase [Neorhodopirellula pilleata]TWU03312.1 putative metallo-hydrolase [Neorhodopirellula pilleata]
MIDRISCRIGFHIPRFAGVLRRMWGVPVCVWSSMLLVGCGKRDEVEFRPPIEYATVESAKILDAGMDVRTNWLGPKTVTVFPGVHALSELFPSAVYAIESEKGIVLIDAGVEAECHLLHESMIKVGLQLSDVGRVLITHAHYDHVFGANRIRELSGASIAIGSEDADVLRTLDLDALYSLFPRTPYEGGPIEVDQTLDDGDVIDLGDATITVVAAPGHTPGCRCFLLEKDSTRIFFSGDVISSLNFGPATYPVHISPKFRGDAEQYLATLDRLLAMPPPDILLPGHPRQQTRGYDVRLSSGQWKSLLMPAREEVQQAVARQLHDGKDFLDGLAKQVESELYYFGEIDGVAVYASVQNGKVIAFNAPGGDRFGEFFEKRAREFELPSVQPDAVVITTPEEVAYSGIGSLDPSTTIFAPRSVTDQLQSNAMVIESFDRWTERFGDRMEVIELPLGVACLIRLQSKQVLITPPAPRNISIAWTTRTSGQRTTSPLQPQAMNLQGELDESTAMAEDYLATVERLGSIRADIWLPARPFSGQNANLYDDDWQRILESNRKVAEQHAP